MSVTSILSTRAFGVADEFFAVRLWFATTAPPHLTAAALPCFEGGIVASALADSVALTTARQVVDPADWSADYATSLTADHTGRQLLIRTGLQAGEVYDVSENAGTTITCAGADFSDVAAGDVVILCDRVRLANPRVDRSADGLMASFSADRPVDGTPAEFNLIDSMDWLYWRCRVRADGETSGWLDVGWFCLDDPTADVSVGRNGTGLTGRDALKLLAEQEWDGTFQADAIKAHQRATASAGLRCVNLKMVDESSGGQPGGNEDGFYRFFDSPEATDPLQLVNHTKNWCVLPPPIFYASPDTNDTISGGDKVLPMGDGFQVLYGSGELRIQAKTYKDSYLVSFPNLKARYSRWATEEDQVRGAATTVAGTVVTDTNLTGALALPTTGDGLLDMTYRITSGAARGRTFGIASNTATAVTLDGDAGAAGMLAGDGYVIHDVNDPADILEDTLRDCDFQMQNADLPLYVDPFDPILVPGTATLVWKYTASGAVYADVTTAIADPSDNTSVLGASGDMLYVGLPSRFARAGFTLATPWTSGTVVVEYWNGAAWATVPAYGGGDTTVGLTATGAKWWNVPNDWDPTTVNASAVLFWVRWRCSAVPSGALVVTQVQILARPSAPPPSEQTWMRVLVEDKAKGDSMLGQFRANNLIPPNWILRADRDGVVTGQEYVQAATAAWSFTEQQAVRRGKADENLVTGVLLRGWSNDQSNLAIHSSTVTITECDEVLALIAMVPPPVDRADCNDLDTGLNLVIDGVDYRTVTSLGIEPGNSGPSFKQRWNYTTQEGAAYIGQLDGLPLWYVDMGAEYDDLSEVRIVIDHRIHPWMGRYQGGVTGDDPIFALEVSSGGGAYATWDWVPLCDAANAQTVEHHQCRDYLFRKGDAGWQGTWRYLRKRCVVGGKTIQGNASAGYVRQSGSVIDLKIYRNQEIHAEVWLGTDAPFTSQAYVDLYRRYRRRLHVVDQIDYSADTEEKTRERALVLLRELAHRSPEYQPDGYRPDADLFQTVALTRPEFELTDELLLVMDVTQEAGGKINARAQSFTLL